jgi:hypothetical protein
MQIYFLHFTYAIYKEAPVGSSWCSHSSLDRSYTWPPPRLRVLTLPKSKSHYDWRSVGQSVLVSGPHLGPATNFSHPLTLIIFRQLRVCWLGRPLWREVGSVACRASPVQPFSHLSPTELMSIFYCLYFWDSLNVEIWLFKVKVMLWLTVSQSVCRGVKFNL